MPICCADLQKLQCFKKIHLLAGESGLYRQITMPFTCTTPTISQWVYGGELLFITGIGIKIDDLSLSMLMQESIDKGLSGMIILKGDEYISSIPSSLVALANHSSFPLFEMPWNLKMIDVIQEILQLIMKDKEQSKKHSRFLEHLLFSNSLNYSFEDLCAYYGIISRPFRFIAIVDIQDFKNERIDIIKSDIARTIRSYIPYDSCEIVSIEYVNMIICLALSENTKSITQLYTSLIKSFKILDKRYPYAGLKLGLGRTSQNTHSIKESYTDALKVISLIRKKLITKNFMHYSELGVFRLLCEIEDANRIQEFCMENIQNLIEADQNNHSQLLKTLRVYLFNNCNLLKTSQHLFIHRNTLLYRLNLIRDILKRDLDDAFVRHELFLSIIAAEFLGLIEI